MNKVILHGHLGADPEVRENEGIISVCTFRVATNEYVKTDDGAFKELTEWQRIAAFGKVAEKCAKFLKKGDQVLVEGKIRSSKWKDKTGKEVTTFQIAADAVQFISNKSEGRAPEEVASSPAMEAGI